MEKAIALHDIFFWDAVEYARVRREYIDIFFKDTQKKTLRAFVDKVINRQGESVLKLSNGSDVPAGQIDHILTSFDPENGLDAISCLCH